MQFHGEEHEFQQHVVLRVHMVPTWSKVALTKIGVIQGAFPAGVYPQAKGNPARHALFA